MRQTLHQHRVFERNEISLREGFEREIEKRSHHRHEGREFPDIEDGRIWHKRGKNHPEHINPMPDHDLLPSLYAKKLREEIAFMPFAFMDG